MTGVRREGRVTGCWVVTAPLVSDAPAVALDTTSMRGEAAHMGACRQAKATTPRSVKKCGICDHIPLLHLHAPGAGAL